MNATGMGTAAKVSRIEKQNAVQEMILERDALERSIAMMIRIGRYFGETVVPNNSLALLLLDFLIRGQSTPTCCSAEAMIASLYKKAYNAGSRPTFFDPNTFETIFESCGDLIRVAPMARVQRELQLAYRTTVQCLERMSVLAAVFTDKESMRFRAKFQSAIERTVEALQPLAETFARPTVHG